MPRSLSTGVVENGYRVKSRSNSYRGLLGRSSSKIIHISIDRQTADEEQEVDRLSYEKILDSYRSSGHSEEEKTETGSSESAIPVFPSVEYESRQLLFGEQPDPDAHKTFEFDRSGWTSRPISVPSGRPTTAMSHVSNYDFESELWTVDGTRCRTPSSTGEPRGHSGRGRVVSAQPAPARPNLPKAAAPGISAHPPTGTAEYIQFAHKMKVPKEFIPTKSRTQTKPTPQPRIRSPAIAPAEVQMRTGKIMTPPSVAPPPAPPASVQDMTTASPETPKRLPSTPLVVEEKAPSPPAVASPKPDVKYAFNIPTAELVAESETNSLADTEEFAVDVPIETELSDAALRERDIEEMATRLVNDVLSRLCNHGDDARRSTTFLTADD